MAKCVKCGISNLSVTITATCSKCSAAVTLCHSCKLAWNIKNCPSCSAPAIQAKWRYLDTAGSGQASDDMMSYLGAFDPQTYIAAWKSATEKRQAERAADGDAAHRGIALPAVEVEFLRSMEESMFEPIYTVADDRASYVVIEDGHVVKLRLFNANVWDKMPATISAFEKLRELRFERDSNRGRLTLLPDTFKDCPELETVVLRKTEANLDVLAKLPKLKRLSLTHEYLQKIDPVFSCTGLEELALPSCSPKRELFDEKIGNLVALKKLNLAFFRYDQGSFSILPAYMKQLQALEELDVHGTYVGKNNVSLWPPWLVELPNLKLVHKDWDSLKGWDVIEPILRQRNPEAYIEANLDPAQARKMNMSDQQKWWLDHTSDILKIGWTGIL